MRISDWSSDVCSSDLELFLLALADDKGPAGTILRDAGLQKKALEAAIDAVRGGENVSAAEGESNREALAKYTLDLTERARQGKLDPVIGRDDEIQIRRAHVCTPVTHAHLVCRLLLEQKQQ